MATSQIYLQGGPCDGKTVSADQIVGGIVAYIKCGGHYYVQDGDKTRPNGDHIWTDYGTTAPGVAGVTPHAHTAWKQLQHALNHDWPATLQTSHRMSAAALRSLSRARKVGL